MINRDTHGRFKAITFLGKNAAYILIASFLIGCGIVSASSRKPDVYVAPATKLTPYEQLIQTETLKELDRESFKADTIERARMNVIMRISDTAQTEMYEYLHPESKAKGTTTNKK